MRLWYRFWLGITQNIFRHAYQLEIVGLHHVPDGGFLIVANHESFLDPPVISCIFDREIHFLGRKTLFKNPAFAWAISSVNCFPVDQERPDMTALRKVIRIIRGGGAVLLFPEGARSWDGGLQAPQQGAGLVAGRIGMPILPIHIEGTFEAYPRGSRLPRLYPLKAVIGAPFEIPPELSEGKSREDYQAVSNLIMEKIRLAGVKTSDF